MAGEIAYGETATQSNHTTTLFFLAQGSLALAGLRIGYETEKKLRHLDELKVCECGRWRQGFSPVFFLRGSFDRDSPSERWMLDGQPLERRWQIGAMVFFNPAGWMP